VSNFYGELLIRITSDTAGLSKGLQKSAAETGAASKAMENTGRKAGRSWERVGLGMQNIGRTMSQFVTIPIAAGFAVAGIAAFKFQDNLMKIQNLTGTSAAQTKLWGDELLKLGAITGQTPIALAESLYFVASSGFKGAEAMDVIKVSAKAAAAGLGDVKVTADVLTSAMNSYGHDTYTAAQVTDYLMKTIEVGKAEPIALATSLGRIMPVANQLKIGLDELGGNVAALTLGGLSSAEAVTALRGTMIALVAPAEMSIDQLKTMGLTYQEVKRSIADKGLLPTLKMLWEEVDHNELAMRKLIPNTRALNGVLSLLGANYGENLKVIEKVSHAQGSLDRAMKNTAQQPVQKLRIAWASLQAEFIKAGALILPVVAGIAQHIVKLAQAVNNLSPGWRSAVMWAGAFVAAAGPIIMVAGSIIRSVALIKGALTGLSLVQGLGASTAAFKVGGMAAGVSSLTAALAPLGLALLGVAAAAAVIYGGTKLYNWLTGTTERMKQMSRAAEILESDTTGKLKAWMGKTFAENYEVHDGKITWHPDVEVETPPPVESGLVKWVKREAQEVRNAIREANKMERIDLARGAAAAAEEAARIYESKAKYARTPRQAEHYKEISAQAKADAQFWGVRVSQLTGQMYDLQASGANLALFSGMKDQENAITKQIAKVKELRAEFEKHPKNAKLGFELTKAERDLKKLQNDANTFKNQHYEAILDVREENARKRLREINKELKALDGQKASPKVDALTAAFEAERKRVKKELADIDAARVSATIRADGSQAITEAGRVKDAIDSLHDRLITIRVNKDIRLNEIDQAQGGVHMLNGPTRFLGGEKGPEIAAFFPLNDPNRSASLLGQLNAMLGQGKSSGPAIAPGVAMQPAAPPVVNVYLDSEPVAARVKILQGQRDRRNLRTRAKR